MELIECKTQADVDTACKAGNIAIVRTGNFTACGSSQVTACGSSQVRACDSSQVTAYGYVALTQQSKNAKIIKTKTCSLIVVPPVGGLDDYLNRYPIKSTAKYCELYKAVWPDLTSINCSYVAVQYPESGKVELKDKIAPPESGSCASGLHFAHFDWAVRFGEDSDIKDFVILKAKIPLDHIVVSPDCDGKVRTDEAVILEVIKDWQHYKPKF